MTHSRTAHSMSRWYYIDPEQTIWERNGLFREANGGGGGKA